MVTHPATPKAEQANVYATLTELNHFADPTIPFAAQYGADGQRVIDEGSPFNSVYLLPLAHRGPEAMDDTLAHLGSYLFHEMTTPLGIRLELLRVKQRAFPLVPAIGVNPHRAIRIEIADELGIVGGVGAVGGGREDPVHDVAWQEQEGVGQGAAGIGHELAFLLEVPKGLGVGRAGRLALGARPRGRRDLLLAVHPPATHRGGTLSQLPDRRRL